MWRTERGGARWFRWTVHRTGIFEAVRCRAGIGREDDGRRPPPSRSEPDRSASPTDVREPDPAAEETVDPERVR